MAANNGAPGAPLPRHPVTVRAQVVACNVVGRGQLYCLQSDTRMYVPAEPNGVTLFGLATRHGLACAAAERSPRARGSCLLSVALHTE